MVSFEFKRLVSLFTFFTLVASQCFFPTSIAASESMVLEEVVVTARKRGESLIDIPESVVSISGDAIDRQNIKGLDKIGLAIPNLNLAMRTDGYPNVSIRGIGAFGLTQGVGFYLDDIQLFSDASSRFGDLERIEVLKGPQGTLYGGSNIGGAVKFVSVRPSPDEMSGRVKVLGGEQGVIDVEGSINIPLGEDGWALRAFAFSREDDGFMSNPNSPNPDPSQGPIEPQSRDVGAYDESGVRLSLAGPLADNLSLYASVRYNEYDGPVNNWARELGGTPSNFTYPTVLDTNRNPTHEREAFGVHLEFTWELDSFDVTSITSYTDAESTRRTDVDLTQFWFLNTDRPEEFEITTQEIRFTSTSDSAFQWIAGIYYSSYENEMNSQFVFGPGILADASIGPIAAPFELREEDNTHLAAFGNMTYTIDDWEVGLGVRIDRWEEDEDNLDAGTNGAIHSEEIDDTEFLPRFSITRHLSNDSMFYFSAAQGYEPGGLNGTTPIFAPDGSPSLLSFEPEKALQYEIGWKGSLMDGRATVSVAAFFIDYEDRAYQVLTPNPNGPGLIEGITNVGHTDQQGLEIEGTFLVNEHLTISAAAGFIDAEWDSGTVMADGTDLSGQTPSNVIDESFSITADYYRPLANGWNLLASMQFSHQGEGESMPPWDPITNDDYSVLNLQVGIQNGPWELMVNVDNVTDEEYYTDLENFPNFGLDGLAGFGPATIVIGTHGHPRIVSASVSYSF